MKASNLKEIVTSLTKSQIPLFIWGSPGIGKSSIVRQVAKESDLEFIDLRLTLMDPTDLKGIPFFDNEKREAIWAKPNFLPSDLDSKGILFLDEINSAPPSVQASAYQLILDRKVGDYTLPDGWSIVAAGNNESDRGVVYRMPSPLANRFVHIDMEVDFEDWKAWAYQKGIDKGLIGFLNYKQDRLFEFDQNDSQKAFATPRSWEYVDKITKSKIDKNLLFETIGGAVGKESATEYLSFLKVMDRLPNIEDIFDGKRIDLYDESEIYFALISSIVSRAKRGIVEESLSNLLNFSHTLPPEFAVMLIRDLQQNGIDIETNPAWESWVERFSYLL